MQFRYLLLCLFFVSFAPSRSAFKLRVVIEGAFGYAFCCLHQCIDVHPERGGDDARRHRYDALLEAAVRHGARHALVAHHAEDQLETIVAALGRGAGPEGLAAMPANPSGPAWRPVDR